MQNAFMRFSINAKCIHEKMYLRSIVSFTSMSNHDEIHNIEHVVISNPHG